MWPQIGAKYISISAIYDVLPADLTTIMFVSILESNYNLADWLTDWLGGWLGDISQLVAAGQKGER